jgi:hypothetical protein
MRLALAATAALAALAAGCAPFQDKHLRALVGEAAPPGASLACEWGKSSYDTEPDAWVGCWRYVRGRSPQVADRVASHLKRRGFAVVGERAPHMVALKATRAGEIVCIDILEQGAVEGRNTSPAEIDPAAGESFLDIWAERPASFAAHCAPLPASPE